METSFGCRNRAIRFATYLNEFMLNNCENGELLIGLSHGEFIGHLTATKFNDITGQPLDSIWIRNLQSREIDISTILSNI